MSPWPSDQRHWLRSFVHVTQLNGVEAQPWHTPATHTHCGRQLWTRTAAPWHLTCSVWVDLARCPSVGMAKWEPAFVLGNNSKWWWKRNASGTHFYADLMCVQPKLSPSSHCVIRVNFRISAHDSTTNIVVCIIIILIWLKFEMGIFQQPVYGISSDLRADKVKLKI